MHMLLPTCIRRRYYCCTHTHSEQELRSWPSSSLLELSKDLPSNPLSTCTEEGYCEHLIISKNTSIGIRLIIIRCWVWGLGAFFMPNFDCTLWQKSVRTMGLRSLLCSGCFGVYSARITEFDWGSKYANSTDLGV